MSFHPEVPVSWYYSGDVAAGKRAMAQAQQMLLHAQQQLRNGLLFVRNAAPTALVPGGEITITGGMGSILVSVYAPPTAGAVEGGRDPVGFATLNWQARGFFLTPASVSGGVLGARGDQAPVRDPESGWVFISKYGANYPDTLFRRKLGVPPDKPTENSKRSLLRFNRLTNAYDLEEFVRRPDGSVESDAAKREKNPYRPGVTTKGVFYPQYKTITELMPGFTPEANPGGAWAAYWPTPRSEAKFEKGLLALVNEARVGAETDPVIPPLLGWTSDVGRLTAAEMAAAETAGHNLPRAAGAPGARRGSTWSATRHLRGGYVESAENVLVGAVGGPDGAAEAFGIWKKSPPHWANIRDPKHTKDLEFTRLWTTDFPAACGEGTAFKNTMLYRERSAAVCGRAGPATIKFHESGPPYMGSIHAVPKYSAFAAAQSFGKTRDAFMQPLIRPVSYPYPINRIYGVSVLPYPMTVDPGVPYLTDGLLIQVHGRMHTIVPTAGHPYRKSLPDGTCANVLAAAYHTDTKGNTYIRAAVHLFASDFIDAGPDTGSVYSPGMGYRHQLRRLVYSVNRVDILDMPFDHARGMERESSEWGFSGEPEFRVVDTLQIPQGVNVVYSAAMSPDGSKFALCYSWMDSPQNRNSAGPTEYGADIFGSGKYRDGVLQPGWRQCSSFGEVVGHYTWAERGGFIWSHNESLLLTAAPREFAYTDVYGVGRVETVYDFSGAADIHLGLRYTQLGELVRIPYTFSASEVAGGARALDVSVKWPETDRALPLVSMRSGGHRMHLMHRSPIYIDHYAPEHTTYTTIEVDYLGVSSQVDRTAADVGVWLGCGVSKQTVLKRLDGYKIAEYWGTGADRYDWKKARIYGVLSGGGEGTWVGTPQYNHSYLTRPTLGTYVTAPGQSVLSRLSVMTSGNFAWPGVSLNCSFPSHTVNINGYVSSDYDGGARCAVPFYAPRLDEVVDSTVDYDVADASFRRNHFNVVALDGEVIVEGLWAYPIAPSVYLYAEHVRDNGEPPYVPAADPTAPGYFRASTLDIDGIIGVKVKYAAPFGVIE